MLRNIPGVALVCVVTLALASGAEAKRAEYTPVGKDRGRFFFKPTGIEADDVRRAKVFMSHDRVSGGRRIAAAKVRRSIRTRTRLKIARPRRARRARLEVVTRPSVGLMNCRFPHASLRGRARKRGCWRPYSKASPFNRRVPGNAPRVQNSQQIVDRWAGFGVNAPVFDAGTAGTGYDYDHPIYYARPWHPRYRVRCTRWVASCEVHGARVRIPRGARPADGGDGHMTVIDAASGHEYDFWQAQPRPGRVLVVSHGGRARLDRLGTGSAATSAHFALGAGVIRPQELAAGKISHALFMVVRCTNGRTVTPALGGGGRSCASIGLSNLNAPRMGEHFVLDMSRAEIDALPTTAWRKTILRAMASYGMYVGDTGGGMLKLQSGASWTSFGYRDPWLRLGRMLGVPEVPYGLDAVRRFDLRETINWRARLKVVKPCVAQGACG